MPVLRRVTPLAALVAVAAAFVLLPIASTPFLGDDQFNSTANGWIGEQHASLNDLAWQTTLGFFRSTSRFVPGFYYQAYGLFHFAPSLAAYKTVQVVMWFLDVAMLVALLRQLKLNAAFSALSALFVLTSVQFYGHYDGFLGFSATAQFWLVLIFGSWLAFASWLRSGGTNWGRRVAVLLFVYSVFNYETFYPISIGHVLIAVHLRGRSAWREAWPFLAVTVAAFAGFIVEHALFPQPANGTYSIHAGSFAYVRTLFYQMTASLPLMYLVFHRDHLFPPGVGFWSVSPPWLLLSVAATAGAAAFLTLRGLAVSTVRALILPACLGFWLWIEDAMLISAVPRYQQEVGPGYGYAPMAFAGFGAAVVMACALGAIVRWIPERNRTALAAGFAVLYAIVLTISFETNQRTIALFEGERAALINLTAALEHGVASDVPNGATLVIEAPLSLTHRDEAMRTDGAGLDNPRFFVREHSGRSLRVRALSERPSAFECAQTACSPANTYGLLDVPLDVRDGFTVVGRIRRVTRLSDGGFRPWVEDLRVHVQGDRIADVSQRAGIVLTYSCASNGDFRIAEIPLAVTAIRYGATLRVAVDCPVDFGSIAIARKPA